MSTISSDTTCPCSSQKTYGDCCEPFHTRSKHAPTAETLMRSRYSAYALGEIDFLITTLPLMDRKKFDRRSAQIWSEQSEWQGLEILQTKESGKGDKATVEFIAKYKIQDEEIKHHEIGMFQKSGDRWFFLDGKVVE